MAAAAITACSGKDAKTTTAAEVVTQADTTDGVTDGETEADTASDSETAAESQSSESASQEAALLERQRDVSHAGAELEQSEIKPFAEKVQRQWQIRIWRHWQACALTRSMFPLEKDRVRRLPTRQLS